MRNLLFLIFIACAILTTTTAADVQHGTPQELTSTEYYKHYFKSGDSYIAGQPSATAIRRLGQQSITAVVNLRTPEEMMDREQVPFDEAALVKSIGLDYIQIPMNGNKAYPEIFLDKFIATYDDHNGKILLHCRSAKRASQIWAAFLVKHEGMAMNDALKIAKSINLGDAPLNGLLGVRLSARETMRL